MSADIYSQSLYRCKLEWGVAGAERAAGRGEIVVIVDTLSFSSAVANAVSQGGWIYPCAEASGAAEIATMHKAEIAVRRQEVPHQGRFSLSPLSFDKLVPGTRVVLPSLNGGVCSLSAEKAPLVVCSAIVNATAVAELVTEQMQQSPLSVTVVACGEREQGFDGRIQLRMAIEDYLGAGAILAGLDFTKSPEAQVCESAFRQNRQNLRDILWESVSGRELRAVGFEADVRFCACLDAIATAPAMISGAFKTA